MFFDHTTFLIEQKTEQKYDFSRAISRKSFLTYGAFALALSQLNSSCQGQEVTKPLRLGINDWIGYQVIQAARSLGYFKQRQLEIDLIYFNNLQDATRAMYRGSLDGTFTTIWDLLELNPERQQVQPVILFVSDISAGADGIVARSPLQNLNDLPGKTIGVKLGTVNHLILLEALHLHKIPAAEIKVENLPNEVAAQQLQAGKLDAAVIWQPLLGDIAQKIGGKIVYNTSQTNSLVIDVLATTQQSLQQKSSLFQRLIWVWLDVMHRLEHEQQSVFNALATETKGSALELQLNYGGVKPGTLPLNQHFFGLESKLTQAITEIISLIEADPHHPKPVAPLIEINRPFTISTLNSWSALP